MNKTMDPRCASTPLLPNQLTLNFEKFLCDKRDMPFIQTVLTIALVMFPFAASFFAYDFSWWVAIPYWVMFVYFLGPFLLTLHLICHRKLFKSDYAWANKLIPWMVGPMFGQIPEGFYAHHVAMHHLENNMHNDLSSTLKYRRDSFWQWLNYFVKFVFLGRTTLLVYLWQRKRKKVFWPLVRGLIFFWGLVALATYMNPKASVVVVWVPIAIAWFGLMAGNWTQHAFVDATDPNNPYKNSITVIDSVYNKRCFNDGYHIGHHLKQARHWTEMPEDFDNNRQAYIDNKSVVFHTHDYQILWIFLMLKRYDILAKYFVDLSGKMSKEDIMNLLRERTAPVA